MTADAPHRLPANRWRQTLVRTFREFQEDNLTDWAAALTYYSVLALFPALISMVSVIGLFGDPRSVTNTITDIVRALAPGTSADTFSGPIESITEHRGAAGVLFVVGLLGSLNAASSYIGAFVRASNVIYEVEEGRPFWKLRPLQVGVTVVLLLGVGLVFAALILSGPLAGAVGRAIGLSDAVLSIYAVVKWPLIAVLVAGLLAFLYYVAPNARVTGVRWVTPGSALALALWLIASAAFAAYVANFGSYDKTYGTLGGAVSFLVWLWITNVAVLLGAELNAELERSRELDAGVPGAAEAIQLPEREAAE